jgi:hypothetical protein
VQDILPGQCSTLTFDFNSDDPSYVAYITIPDNGTEGCVLRYAPPHGPAAVPQGLAAPGARGRHRLQSLLWRALQAHPVDHFTPFLSRPAQPHSMQRRPTAPSHRRRC